MGVGAAIAIGNQGEKGKIADFVIKVTIKKKTTKDSGLNLVKTKPEEE